MGPKAKRWLWGVLITTLLLVTGLAAGLYWGASVTPKGSGLAGPAIVLGYGFLTAAAAALVGVFLSVRTSIYKLGRAAAICGALAAVAVALLATFAIRRQAERGVQLAPAISDNPPVTAPAEPIRKPAPPASVD